MFNAIASFLGYLMNFIYGIVQNYGIAIIIFTVLLKLALLPFTIKQQKSLKKNQELQPLVQELQRKYGNDQQKFSEEYQKLLKEKDMNIASGMGCSGCLISLIQIPIVFGMFYMMVSPLTNILKLDTTEIEKYKAEVQEIKVQEAIEEIEKSSSLYTEEEIQNLIEKARNTNYLSGRYYEIEIMKYIDLVNMDFLGLNLCDIASYNIKDVRLWVIPILSFLCTFIMTKMNSKDLKKTMKEQQESDLPMPDMNMMNVTLLITTGYIGFIVPQGVGLYWAVNNLLTVIQQLYFKREKEKESIEK